SGQEVVVDLGFVHLRQDDPLGHLRTAHEVAGAERIAGYCGSLRGGAAVVTGGRRNDWRIRRIRVALSSTGRAGRARLREADADVLRNLNPGEERVGSGLNVHEVSVVVVVRIGQREVQGVVGNRGAPRAGTGLDLREPLLREFAIEPEAA